MIYEYRISKYDLSKRVNGAFIGDDWISISDIGKTFNNELLTHEKYMQSEESYLNVIKQVCKQTSIDKVTISKLEDRKKKCKYKNKSVVKTIDDIIDISRNCLREQYWCRLDNRKKPFFIHFGYDYYMYIGTSLDYCSMKKITDDCGLFLEAKESPYK